MNGLEVICHDDGDHVTAEVYRGVKPLGMATFYPRENSFAGGTVRWAKLDEAEMKAVQGFIRNFAGQVGLFSKED